MATSNKKSFLFYIFIFLVVTGTMTAALAAIAYKTLPSVENINDCFKTSMFQVELCPKKSSYVRYNQLPKHLVSSLIASEDASFYFHKGFDWDEIKDSLEKSMDAGRWVRGGSTITQQLAKNLYLSPEKSLLRKMKEFFVARQLEKKLTKTQIIEKYFNVVEFGKNIYGIRAAADHYFQTSPANLTPAEGAYLISLLPSPIKYSAGFHNNKELTRYNKNRVTRTLSLLKMQGKISEEEYQTEIARVDYGLWSGPPPSEEFNSESTFMPGETSTEDGTSNSLSQPTSDAESVPSSDEENEAPAIDGDY